MEKENVSRKKLKGIIVSDKMKKTVVVLVNRFIKHKQYGKYVKVGKKYKVHCEGGDYKTGDGVVIEEHRPFSKDKHFKVLKKI